MRQAAANDERIEAATGQRRLLDVDGLPNRLGVTPRFVRRLVHERRVPFLKIGKFVRFDPREIEAWTDANRRSPRGPAEPGEQQSLFSQ